MFFCINIMHCFVKDWLVAVDSLDTTLDHTISERLEYAVPVMMAPPLGDPGHLPPEEGWMVLDHTGHWAPDPSIRLIGHHRRPSDDDLAHVVRGVSSVINDWVYKRNH